MYAAKWKTLVLVAAAVAEYVGTSPLLAETGAGQRDAARGRRAPGRGNRAAPQANPLFELAHRDLLSKARAGGIDLYFLGDSITRRWHANDYPAFQENWKRNFWGWNAANFGWGGDRTENVLWRLANGELDGVHPKAIVLMVGTNNVGDSPRADDDVLVEDVTNGIAAILKTLQEKAPEAKIVLLGITPRNAGGSAPAMPIINRINSRLAQLADGQTIKYLNINDKLADSNGRLHNGVTEDGLHLSTAGYQIWADALKPILNEWLGPRAKVDTAPPPTGIPVAE
jgi:lysophospholipase L1-like esterase